MKVFDHFGILAPIYDRVIKLPNPERLTRLLDLPVLGALLDAGGGTGRVAQALFGLAEPLVIVDLSLEMLQQAQAKNGFRITCSHTERLPFPDASFERIVMVDALHHVCDHAETASELWRVLKPGGRLVIEEPDIRNFSIKLVAVAEKLALMRSHFISPLRIKALFNYAEAQVDIELEGHNAWVIVRKNGGETRSSD
jgi:demethylmenaquinone methyltransferase/2-methoxy-6-polyprenyl-1,4-benzoquinol methylase